MISFNHAVNLLIKLLEVLDKASNGLKECEVLLYLMSIMKTFLVLFWFSRVVYVITSENGKLPPLS